MTSVAFGQVVLHFLVWFGIAVATIQIQYRVSGFAKRDGLYLCAISATSDSYIGARRKSDGSGMCEPLHFSWFETSVYEDSYEYIMKVCVKRDFPLQVQIFIYLLFINCFRNKTWWQQDNVYTLTSVSWTTNSSKLYTKFTKHKILIFGSPQ